MTINKQCYPYYMTITPECYPLYIIITPQCYHFYITITPIVYPFYMTITPQSQVQGRWQGAEGQAGEDWDAASLWPEEGS